MYFDIWYFSWGFTELNKTVNNYKALNTIIDFEGADILKFLQHCMRVVDGVNKFYLRVVTTFSSFSAF